MQEFVARHEEKITAVLHCLDRVIFHGHLPFCYAEAMDAFRRSQSVRLADWARFVQRQSEEVRRAAEEMVREAGRPCVYQKSHIRKEQWAHQIAERDGIKQGLVAILRTTEKCRSFHVRGAASGYPRLVGAPRRCLHLYFFFIDPVLGWIHVRLQTWFPFLIQIGVNGHDILARSMDREGIGYTRIDNGFTQLDDPERAQRLADGIATMAWSHQLDRVARLVNPLFGGLLRGLCYDWSIDQCEFSTDLLFRDTASLNPLFQQLVRHASFCLAAEDILGFFGRPLLARYRGEVLTEHRPCHWGQRVKHRAGRNWIKMYDKAGSILRIETVINAPQDFRIRRFMRRRDGTRVKGLFSLPKAVAFLHRFVEIQRRANEHYLRALRHVEDPAAAYRQIAQLGSPALRKGARHRALNPLSPLDRDLILAVLRAEHHLQGFRNEHIRSRLFPGACEDPKERKRQSARIRRLLLNLRAHGYLRKSGASRRYRVTDRGLKVLCAALLYCRSDLPEQLMKAA